VSPAFYVTVVLSARFKYSRLTACLVLGHRGKPINTSAQY